MLYERRQAKRTPVGFDVRWQGEAGVSQGVLSDISAGGCFVLTSGLAMPKELVRLEIDARAGRILIAWGIVVEHCPEIGFSLRFTGLDDNDRRYVERIVERAERYRREDDLRAKPAPGSTNDLVLKF